jgi:hypothetical protein
MLPDDSEKTAQISAATFDDPRVLHFYDPAKRSGEAIAESVGWVGHIAWDIYLVYETGIRWGQTPPLPNHWMHQLKDSWADREYFRTGDALANELFDTMEKMLKY